MLRFLQSCGRCLYRLAALQVLTCSTQREGVPRLVLFLQVSSDAIVWSCHRLLRKVPYYHRLHSKALAMVSMITAFVSFSFTLIPCSFANSMSSVFVICSKSISSSTYSVFGSSFFSIVFCLIPSVSFSSTSTQLPPEIGLELYMTAPVFVFLYLRFNCITPYCCLMRAIEIGRASCRERW